MKTINLSALSQITFEEVESFLSWLGQQASGGTSLAEIQKSPPIRTSKLNPMLKTLEQFGFIAQKQGRFLIHEKGVEFLRSEGSVKRAVIRTVFIQVEWINKIVQALDISPSGRVHRSLINDTFAALCKSAITESDISAFVQWAEYTGLFGFDKKTYELVRIDSIVPRDPRPVTPALRLVS
jgi:hypothetical protein